MGIVDLDLLKKHVRADDFTDDDDYLRALLETCESWVVRATRKSVSELKDENDGVFPTELRHAILLLAGHYYNQREAVSVGSMQEVPYGVSALVKPFVKLGV